MSIQESEILFGKIAIKKGFANRKQIKAGLRKQQMMNLKEKQVPGIGSILVDMNILSEEEVGEIARFQQKYQKNKQEKNGDRKKQSESVNCPSCGEQFQKNQIDHNFTCSNCTCKVGIIDGEAEIIHPSQNMDESKVCPECGMFLIEGEDSCENCGWEPDESIEKRIKKWKKNLIDLSFRNRLLNYKERRSSVEVVDEWPQPILIKLLQEERLQFEPLPESQEKEEKLNQENEMESDQGSISSKSEELKSNRIFEKGVRLELESNKEVDSIHEDDQLQTPYEKQKLEEKLLTLYRESKSKMEEQGVNTLYIALGMLEWYEDPTSEEVRKSPVLLAPVQLHRETARSGYHLTMGEGSPLLNPALREKLKEEFQIELPDVAEISEDGEIDPDKIFLQVRKALEDYERWEITRDMVLDMFRFHKFLMYRELDEHKNQFIQDDLIRTLCGENQQNMLGELPEEIRQADLDDQMSPWSTTQILDADASQQRAIFAVREGHDLIIEGPPGTGKSQTITNLIAEALTDGKSVLFVSEKMAALEVVESRLHENGLGDYCLELHSNKTSKNRFTDEIAHSLNQERPEPPEDERKLEKLQRKTEQLQNYVNALHEPVTPLEKSPYEGIEELAKVENHPFLNVKLSRPLNVSADQYRNYLELLDEFSEVLGEVSPPDQHPLRGIGLTHSNRSLKEKLKNKVQQAIEKLKHFEEFISKFSEKLGLRNPETFQDVDQFIEGSKIIETSPGMELSILKNEKWDRESEKVELIIEVGKNYETSFERIEGRIHVEKLNEDVRTFIDALKNFRKKGGWRFLNPFYWKFRWNLGDFYVPGADSEEQEWFGDEELLNDLKAAQRCSQARKEIEDFEERGENLFGSLWDGPESNWDELEEFTEWITEFRTYAQNNTFTEKGYQLAAEGIDENEKIQSSRSDIEEVLADIRNIISQIRKTVEAEQELNISTEPESKRSTVLNRLKTLNEHLDELPKWTGYVNNRNTILESDLSNFVRSALQQGISPEDLEPSFRRWFFRNWLEEIYQKREVLRDFRGNIHENRIEEFRELDEESKRIARERARYTLAQKRRQLLKSDQLRDQLQYLQRQAEKRRNVHPIRHILKKAPDAVQCVKPCFMMSPLSVSKYLDAEDIHFDLLIFDEASQITPENAVGAFLRSDQVVIVGDSKQLPPTNFFSVKKKQDPGDFDPDQIKDLESVLKEMKTAGIPSKRLKYHYRSEDESLIRFSNEEFYSDDPLYTFPSQFRNDDFMGLKFRYLPDVSYEGGGKNEEEAQVVVEAITEHIKERPHLSLGVATFGQAQQRLIQDLVYQKRQEDPALEHFFDRDGEEGFFVKNLERIQGDDRDVIFISVTYDASNRRFGPINKDGGWRRLNVITTRAKKQVKVFSCMRGMDIDLSGNISENVEYLRRYLKYARTGNYPKSTDPTGGTPDSPFEKSVISSLEEMGYQVIPQVGESGYKIDIGVLDPDHPGQFICGIECDGATYHSAATVRDRDRLRQAVLERRGWEIIRVWSTDWFNDKKGQLERLQSKIEQARKSKDKKHPADPPENCTTLKDEGNQEEGKTNEDGNSEEERKDDDKPELSEISVESYRLVKPNTKRSRDHFYDCKIHTNISEKVIKVVKAESPIHIDPARRRVMSFWELNRMGNKIRKRIDAGIQYAVEHDEIERREQFLWNPEMEQPPVRTRDIEGHKFESRHICYEEAAEAIRLLLKHRAPLKEGQIPTEVVRLLGFKRAGKNLKELVERATKALIEEGEIVPGGYGLQLKQEKGEGAF